MLEYLAQQCQNDSNHSNLLIYINLMVAVVGKIGVVNLSNLEIIGINPINLKITFLVDTLLIGTFPVLLMPLYTFNSGSCEELSSIYNIEASYSILQAMGGISIFLFLVVILISYCTRCTITNQSHKKLRIWIFLSILFIFCLINIMTLTMFFS